MSQVSQQLSQVGSEQGLCFSSQEVLKHWAFGLDGLHRKMLLICRLSDDFSQEKIVDLDELKTCSVKKVYGSIEGGALKSKKLEQHLRRIILHFEFSNNKPAIELCFYEDVHNSIYQVSEMEQKARHWQAILSKIISSTSKPAA